MIASVDAFLAAANAEPRSSSLQPGFYALKRKMQAGEALALLLDPKSRVQAKVVAARGAPARRDAQAAGRQHRAPARRLQGGAQGRQARWACRPTRRRTPRGSSSRRPTTFRPNADAPRRAQADVRELCPRRRVDRGRAHASARRTSSSSSPAWSRPRRATPRTSARSPGSSTTGSTRGCRCSSTPPSTTRSRPTRSWSPSRTSAPTRRTTPTRTPACRPGRSTLPARRALEAAVNPPDGDWLYFVTVNPESGETKFTSSYQEFLRFKQEQVRRGAAVRRRAAVLGSPIAPLALPRAAPGGLRRARPRGLDLRRVRRGRGRAGRLPRRAGRHRGPGSR